MRLWVVLSCAGLFLAGPCRGFCAGEPATSPSYPDHTRLLVYRDGEGHQRPGRTAEDWSARRRHILAGMEAAMGALPDRSHLPPLDIRLIEQIRTDNFTRLKLAILAASSPAG